MNRLPKVSVVTVSYNQEKFIAQALKSIVSQRTEFSFELIVSDDCSTDGTRDIIKQFAREYPEIVKPVLRKRNVGAVRNFVEAMQMAEGQYVALCEGDDFWTDDSKIQRQVDFLDGHQSHSLCFHPTRVFYEGGQGQDYEYPEEREPSKFTVGTLLQRNYIQTNSVMYRRKSYADVPMDILPLDWYLHLYHAQTGKVGFINQTMSAYRKHADGLWWDSNDNPNALWRKHGLAHLRLYEEVLKMYGKELSHRTTLERSMVSLYDKIVAADDSPDSELLTRALAQFPYGTAVYVADLLKRSEMLQVHSGEQAKIIQHVTAELSNLETSERHLGQLVHELRLENSNLRNKMLVRLEGKLRRSVKRITRSLNL